MHPNPVPLVLVLLVVYVVVLRRRLRDCTVSLAEHSDEPIR